MLDKLYNYHLEFGMKLFAYMWNYLLLDMWNLIKGHTQRNKLIGTENILRVARGRGWAVGKVRGKGQRHNFHL